MVREVVIDRRFRGPPASANGGYASGILAAALGGHAAEVNLRKPPPLDRPLALSSENGSAAMTDGEELVADARALDGVELELADPPPMYVAEDADARSEFYDDHAYPSCFVCGPARERGDGLRIHPGEIEGRLAMACVWTPDAEFATGDGRVDDRIVWAALDCPSGIAAHHYAPDETRMVLARIRAAVARPLTPSNPYIVMGWTIDRDDRKHRAATAIFDASGSPHAWADTLWIELRSKRDG